MHVHVGSMADACACRHAFAALRDDGSIAVWGSGSYGGTGAPAGKRLYLLWL